MVFWTIVFLKVKASIREAEYIAETKKLESFTCKLNLA